MKARRCVYAEMREGVGGCRKTLRACVMFGKQSELAVKRPLAPPNGEGTVNLHVKMDLGGVDLATPGCRTIE